MFPFKYDGPESAITRFRLLSLWSVLKVAANCFPSVVLHIKCFKILASFFPSVFFFYILCFKIIANCFPSFFYTVLKSWQTVFLLFFIYCVLKS